MDDRFDIFISFAHKDGRKLAEEVAHIVSDLGMRAFIDVEEPAWKGLKEKIRQVIQSCRYLILILTNDAAVSAWVDAELQYALDRKPIVVVKSRRNIKIPRQLHDCTQIERNNLRDGLEKLIGLPVIVPAGGAGRRLLPITDNMPKALLPVGDKPMLEWILESLTPVEFSHVTIIVQRYESMIKHWVNRFHHNIPVEYFSASVEATLTDSLISIAPKREFLFHVCDVLPNPPYPWQDLIKKHRFQVRTNPKVAGTLLVNSYYNLPVGAVTRDRRKPEYIDKFLEKPNELPMIDVNMGVAIFEPSFIDYIRAQKTTLKLSSPFEYVERAVRDKDLVFSFLPHHSGWKHIQSVADWYDAQREYFDDRGQTVPVSKDKYS